MSSQSLPCCVRVKSFGKPRLFIGGTFLLFLFFEYNRIKLDMEYNFQICGHSYLRGGQKQAAPPPEGTLGDNILISVGPQGQPRKPKPGLWADMQL